MERTDVVAGQGAQVIEGTVAVRWLQLLCGAAAVGFGALAYHEHFHDGLPWWRWLAQLLFGTILLCTALADNGDAEEGRTRYTLRLVAGGVAVLLAGVAVYEVPLRGQELTAGLAVIGALLAFVLARWRPFTPAEVRLLAGGEVRSEPAARGRQLGVIVCLGGMALCVAAAVANRDSPLAGCLLWLVSLLAFAFGARRLSSPSLKSTPGWRSDCGPPLSRGAEAACLFLVLVVAFGLRVALLDQVPDRVDMDEGRFGRYAEEMWQDGFPDVFALGWNVFPNLSYVVGYVGVQLWGDSMMNLRLSYAVIGVISLIPIFYWARRWWGNVVALIAVALMAVNYSHLYWSRIGLNNIHQVLVAALVLAALARALDERRPLDWVWLGYAAGIGFYTYHAAKVFPFLLIPAFVLFAVGVSGFARRHWRGVGFGMVAFLLCVGPLALETFLEWERFAGGTANRTDVHVLLNAYTAGDVDAVRRYVYDHVVGCLYVVISTGHAFLSPIPCALFLIGFGWVAWTWRDPRHLVALTWLAGIVVTGGMITWEPPNTARLLGIFPVIFVVPAIVAGRLRGLAHRCVPGRADIVVVAALLVCGGLTAHYNWHRLFVVHVARAAGALIPAVCSVLERTPLPTRIYVGGGKLLDPTIAPNTCMMPLDAERTFFSLANDAAIAPLPPDHEGNALLLVLGDQDELVALVEHYYPGAKRWTHGSAESGQGALHFFTLEGGPIDRSRGLAVLYRSGDRVWAAPATQHIVQPPQDERGEVSARASGLVWISPPGSYRFKSTRGSVEIDGRVVDADVPLALAEGWHGLEVNVSWQEARSAVTLSWLRQGQKDWAAIERPYLFAHPEVHGLLGRYFARMLPQSSAEPIAEAADYVRIDTALSFDLRRHGDVTPPPGFGVGPSTMEWTGTIVFPEGDVQEIKLDSSAATQIFLDGEEVLSTPGAAHPVVTEKVLTGVSGRKSILVRTRRAADDGLDYWTLRLLWRVPGGTWSGFVPYAPAAPVAADAAAANLVDSPSM